MNTSRSALRSAAVVLGLAMSLAGCNEKEPVAPPVHAVLVTTIGNSAHARERSFTGVLRARQETDLGFRTSGKIVARLVDVGQAVTAGQQLARLDPADYDLAVRAAENQVQAARADAEQAALDEARLRRLVADGSVPVADHERQKARAAAAAAHLGQASRQYDLARNKMKYTTLVAEFGGVVTSVRFEAGQVVAEGQPLLTIAKPTELEVVADLPEEMTTKVASLPATATFWDAPNLVVPLKLRELSPSAAAQTRTFRARFSIDPASLPAGHALHLGTTATLRLAEQDDEAAALLPATAIVKTAGGPAVWQVDEKEQRLSLHPVKILRYTDETVLVSGLVDGAQVVTVGVHKLDRGMTVVAVRRNTSGTTAGGASGQKTPVSVVEGKS